jgi:LysR family transcriptional activator of dmlA
VNNLPAPQDLLVFTAVARFGNFKTAADELGMSPAFISKRVRLLESMLHLKLFHRTTRSVSLTDDGKRLLGLATEVLDKLDRLVAESGLGDNTLKGRLRVCSSFGFGRKIVGPIIGELIANFPELHIRFEVLDKVIDPVAQGFDLDLRIGDQIAPHLIARKLADNERWLVAAPSYLAENGIPKHLSELSKHRCITIKERDHPVGVWQMNICGKQESISVNDAISTNNGEIAVDWALAGCGILLRSAWDINQHVTSGKLQRVLPEYSQPASIYAVYPAELRDTHKIKTIVDFFRERI